MAMLYWSSLLLEDDMKEMQLSLKTIEKEMARLRIDASKIQPSRPTQVSLRETEPTIIKEEAAYPNLLHADPFYENTLPSILGSSFYPHGTLLTASFGVPSNLNPFTNWSTFAEWNALCNVSVAKQQFGKYETFTPYMALRLEERRDPLTQIPEYWVHLRDDLYWEPLKQSFFPSSVELAPWFFEKHPVTAYDFQFYYEAVMNPYIYEGQAVTLRTYLSGIEKFQVIDPTTFVVRWKTKEIEQTDGSMQPTPPYSSLSFTGALRPLASFVYQYLPDGTKSFPMTMPPQPIAPIPFGLRTSNGIGPTKSSSAAALGLLTVSKTRRSTFEGTTLSSSLLHALPRREIIFSKRALMVSGKPSKQAIPIIIPSAPNSFMSTTNSTSLPNTKNKKQQAKPSNDSTTSFVPTPTSDGSKNCHYLKAKKCAKHLPWPSTVNGSSTSFSMEWASR